MGPVCCGVSAATYWSSAKEKMSGVVWHCLELAVETGVDRVGMICLGRSITGYHVGAGRRPKIL